MPDAQVSRAHAVVVNDEEQYSIWPVGRDPAVGWQADGFTGTEGECLTYMDEVWTDDKWPAALREWMDDHERAGAY